MGRRRRRRRRSSQMGSEKICLLLIMSFMYLDMFATASSLRLLEKVFSSDSLEGIDQGNKHVPEHKHGIGKANVDYYAESGILESSSKYARGTGFGGEHAAGSSGFGDHGSNGGSGTPSVIPEYAGGAASNRHPNTHHNAGNHNQIPAGFLTLMLSVIAWFVLLHSG